MKRLVLRKKPKRLALIKNKDFNTDKNWNNDLKKYHDFLDKHIKLSEQKNKMNPVVMNRVYSYKDKFPPNNFKIKVMAYSHIYEARPMISAVLLQHLISETLYYKRKPIYDRWSTIKTNRKALKR